MNARDAWHEVFRFARVRTLDLLASIEKEADPDAVLRWRPAPGRAPVGWQLMHIGITEEIFATERLAPEKPAAWKELWPRFRGGSTPDEDLPSVGFIRRLLDESREHLEETLARWPDDKLDEIPETMAPRRVSVRSIHSLLPWHEAHHQGQAHLAMNLYRAARDGGSSPVHSASAGEPVIDAIHSRRSIRHYENRPVPEELVERLLRAAMAAPSARNAQPWHFVVIDDRQILDAYAAEQLNAGMAARAPLAILVCADLGLELSPGYWPVDCAAAVENLLLAAHASGLGAVWTGVYPNQARMAALGRRCGLPDSVMPHSLVVIGYPAEQPPPEDRYRPDRIHRNGWR